MINKSIMKHLEAAWRAGKGKVQSGFTITELLVATAVFAGVLLLAVLGFTQIGRLFYKGVTVSQTRQTATQIINAATNDIRLSSIYNQTAYTCNTICAGGANVLPAYCVGNHVYIPNWNNRVNLSNHDFINNFGLMQAQTAGSCSGTGVGGAFTSDDLKNDSPIEMLGDNMRIIQPVSGDLIHKSGNYSFQVTATVAYGEDSVFNNLGDPAPTCKGVTTGSQFCSVITLSASASNRPAVGQ